MSKADGYHAADAMHLLLTNDDGFAAPGLAALHRAIGADHRITVVAPEAECSACGHTATLRRPIRVREVEVDSIGSVFAVGGTPVDCVRLALCELSSDPIDCVVAGINYGANVSAVDLAVSGTVAAAREAAFNGLYGVAVSQMFFADMPVDWAGATAITATLLPQLLDRLSPACPIWSVNIPAPAPGERPASVRVLPASNDQIPMAYRERAAESAGAGKVYEYAGRWESRTITPDTDLAAAFGGEVAVTPLAVNPTNPSAPDRPFTV